MPGGGLSVPVRFLTPTQGETTVAFSWRLVLLIREEFSFLINEI